MEEPTDPTPEHAPQQGGEDPQPSPTPSGLDGLKQEGPASGEPWYKSTLPEELRNDEKVANFASKYSSLEEAIKGGAHAASKLGEKSEGLKPPGPDADPTEWSAFYNAIGRPEDPNSYTWEPPEGIEVENDRLSDTKSKLHGLGLTESQFQGVMNMYADELKGMNDSMQEQADEMKKEAIQQTRDTLAEEWGSQTNERIEDAKRAADRFGISEWLDQSGAIANPNVIRMLATVEQGMAEDPTKVPTASPDPSDRVEQLKKHPAYMDKNHPEHRNVLKELVQIDMK